MQIFPDDDCADYIKRLLTYARKVLARIVLLAPFPGLCIAAHDSKHRVRLWASNLLEPKEPGPVTAPQFALQVVELVKNLTLGTADFGSRLHEGDFGRVKGVTALSGLRMNGAQIGRNCRQRVVRLFESR